MGELESLERSLNEYKEQNAESHREIFARLNKLERESAVIIERYDIILEKLDRLTEKVDALEARPGKRWEGIIEKVILSIAGAVTLFLLARAGIG